MELNWNFLTPTQTKRSYKRKVRKVYKTGDIICTLCAKACNIHKCEWVHKLTLESIPTGAEFYINEDTGNPHITACPDFIRGRNGDESNADN